MGTSIELRPTYWASLSGGKDSLYMLYQILKHPKEYPLDGVVHYELETDFPFIKDIMREVRKKCEMIGLDYISIKPRKTWEELYLKYGYPSRLARWCNSEYKLDAEKQLRKILKEKGKRLVSYIGFCYDEPKRFRYDLGERNGVSQIYPLAEMGITEDYILNWAKGYAPYNDYYIYNKRCGCMGCPMASLNEWAYLKQYYRDKYNKIFECIRESEKRINVSPFAKWSDAKEIAIERRRKRVYEDEGIQTEIVWEVDYGN